MKERAGNRRQMPRGKEVPEKRRMYNRVVLGTQVRVRVVKIIAMGAMSRLSGYTLQKVSHVLHFFQC